MSRPGSKAKLYLKGQLVGSVVVRGSDASWAYGEFHPDEAFVGFAPIFGQWSLLMHADDDKLSSHASEELRRVEATLDALRARLHFPEKDEWLDLAQINIDGSLIEWKRY
jgi:hypothetical protein